MYESSMVIIQLLQSYKGSAIHLIWSKVKGNTQSCICVCEHLTRVFLPQPEQLNLETTDSISPPFCGLAWRCSNYPNRHLEFIPNSDTNWYFEHGFVSPNNFITLIISWCTINFKALSVYSFLLSDHLGKSLTLRPRDWR